jgi:hypothetical protein
MIAKGLAKVLSSIALLLLLSPPPLSHLVPTKTALAIELNSVNDIVNNFTKNLSDEINDIVSNAINSSSIGSTRNVFLSNASNMTSSQIVISNNNMSTGNIISNQVISKNGVCSSNIVGGPGNNTISSTGVCNDQLTGGLGADKFVCGQGTDTVRGFNSKEGDIIIDPQNCETIL